MVLLDAPRYDARKARIRRNIIIGILIAIPFVAFFTWYWWNWPEEHRVNQFFHAVEAKDYSRAFALWNNDPEWQQHPDRYNLYPFKQFVSDWGPSGDYGVIKTGENCGHQGIRQRSYHRSSRERQSQDAVPLGRTKSQDHRIFSRYRIALLSFMVCTSSTPRPSKWSASTWVLAICGDLFALL